MIKQERFMQLISKLRLLNPQADIGVSSKSTAVIWSEIEASDLVLMPGVELYTPRSIRLDGFQIVDVLNFGEHPELA